MVKSLFWLIVGRTYVYGDSDKQKNGLLTINYRLYQGTVYAPEDSIIQEFERLNRSLLSSTAIDSNENGGRTASFGVRTTLNH